MSCSTSDIVMTFIANHVTHKWIKKDINKEKWLVNKTTNKSIKRNNSPKQNDKSTKEEERETTSQQEDQQRENYSCTWAHIETCQTNEKEHTVWTTRQQIRHATK